MSKANNYGQGTIDRFHNHPSCPPAEAVTGADGKVRKVRPHHECRGPWRGRTMATVSGKRVRKTVYGKTRAMVVTKMKKVTVAEGNGTLSAATTTMTVEQWITLWLSLRDDLKEQSVLAYEGANSRYIFPLLGSHRLDRLTPEHLEGFYKTLRERGLTDGTLHVSHTVLTSSLKAAQRRGHIPVNPCTLIKAPSQKKGEERDPLTLAEAWAVLDTAGDDPRWWVALFCGLRQGEALALRWTDLSLDSPVPFLTVTHNVARVGSKGWVLGTPKTKTSAGRVVPLVEPVVERLTKARAAHLLAGGAVEDFVFMHGWKVRQPWLKDWRHWTDLLVRAGVDPRPLHAARNTTAVLLEDAGVSDRAVAAILGHATVQMTHHYQKRNAGPALRAGAALDALLAQSANLKVVRSKEAA